MPCIILLDFFQFLVKTKKESNGGIYTHSVQIRNAVGWWIEWRGKRPQKTTLSRG